MDGLRYRDSRLPSARDGVSRHRRTIAAHQYYADRELSPRLEGGRSAKVAANDLVVLDVNVPRIQRPANLRDNSVRIVNRVARVDQVVVDVDIFQDVLRMVRLKIDDTLERTV